ncbi:MAG: DUF2259 domain-containing protein [Treponema sp.]|nr:DUF2259 domain-containing protein [Treponema sp.]
MKKSALFGAFIFLGICSLHAGDVASFVDKGFTEDGKYYIFGQYGVTDKKFQGWAEIFQVDIAANDYVDSGVFSIKPTAVTSGKQGKEVYDSLEVKSFDYYKNLKTEVANPDHILYILDDVNKKGTDEIVFKDFRGSKDIEQPDTYHIQLIPTVTGSGKNVKSSFYIMLEKRDANGKIITSKKIGSPDIVRKGVKNYKIERIFCDKSEKNLIFVVEKMLEDDTGISIRYMVEAAAF